MPVHNYFKILFLPKWFPHRNDPFNGNFVERHIKSIATECKCAVLFVVADPKLEKKYEIVSEQDHGYLAIRVYYKNKDWGNSPLGKSIKLFRYLKAAYLGLKFVKTNFGKPNLCHVHVLSRPGIIALGLHSFNAIPYLITEHWSGYFEADGSYRGWLKKSITQLIVKRAKGVTTVSVALQKAMEKHGLTNSYTKISNCVETNLALNQADRNPNLCVMIGNLEDREKNVSGVIRAIDALKNRLPHLQLQLIGAGVDEVALKKLVAELGLNERVFFKGLLPHNQVMEALSSASFLIVNSHFETFSVVAAEALACGTPVLATKCGGIEEFILPEFGQLIPLNDYHALIDGIQYMQAHSKDYNKQSMRDFAQKQFSSTKIAQQFIELYKPLISIWEAGNTREKLTIPSHWSVLDVGSGDHPNERADVLLEREIEATEHRSGAVAVVPKDKKLVLGDATEMPFKEKEFDFVIASHIAEHIDNPEKFCQEIQRVAHAGYIETPDAFSEFIFNEPFHLWIVSNQNGTLCFTEKTKHKVFSEWFYRFYYLNEERTNHKVMRSNNIFVLTFVQLLRKCWRYLPRTYTRFHWKDKFEFKVIRKSQHD